MTIDNTTKELRFQNTYYHNSSRSLGSAVQLAQLVAKLDSSGGGAHAKRYRFGKSRVSHHRHSFDITVYISKFPCSS